MALHELDDGLALGSGVIGKDLFHGTGLNLVTYTDIATVLAHRHDEGAQTSQPPLKMAMPCPHTACTQTRWD
eukprot:23476-Eustigmatos_ZCMA.PRE.1